MKQAALEVFKSDQRFRPGMHIFVNRAFEAFNIPQHTHDAIEISYVTEGTGYQFIDQTVIPVKRGDIYLLPIGTSHVYRPSSPEKARTLGVINCVFQLEALPYQATFPPPGSELHTALFTPETMPRPWFHHYDKNSIFAELFHTMLSEYRQSQPGYEVVVQGLFTQIVALLHRGTLLAAPAYKINLKIQDAIRYIKNHFHEDITLKEVADRSFLSVSHLQRLFKQTTGMCFTTFVQQLRVQRCCELLKSTPMTVQQIAGAVGYHDMKFFHALFRQRTGMTPQEYRKNDDIAPSADPVAFISSEERYGADPDSVRQAVGEAN